MSVAQVRLTSLSSGGGCATKISQAELLPLVGALGLGSADPALLVGADDDAAVWRLRDDLAVVLTTDFFAPVVDDPADYGAIAATNALSDVYAMGGTPVCALNIVAWPGEDVLPPAVLETVLRAGAAVVNAAGAAVVGGHSVRDAEPKYGLAVLGTVDPDRILSNRNGRAGDVLVLTKALGTGIVANALKQGAAPEAVAAAAIRSMRTLNARAAELARAHGVRCATDVTGFGLLGHARTIGTGSGLMVEIGASGLPELPGVADLVDAGFVPGGSRRNRDFADGWTEWGPGVPELGKVLATDAQTSGGLLLAVGEPGAGRLVDALEAAGIAAWVVGRLTTGTPGQVRAH